MATTTVVGGRHSSTIELKTGALLLLGSDLQARRSTDDDRSWGKFAPLIDKQGLRLDGGPGSTGILRLNSGNLAMTYSRTPQANGPPGNGGLFLRISYDDGVHWLPEVDINQQRVLATSYHNAMIQLCTGRLVLPVRWTFGGNHAEMELQNRSWGRLSGQRFAVEGHAHRPEMDVAFVYYSDDEGQTWQHSDGELMGWFNEGYEGITPVDEPVVAELRDGRLVLFARSTVGRIVRSYSDDGGETWSCIEATNLASSYSPCRLIRVPETNHLLLVWNQVSGEEIRRGYRRGRLSTAISRDEGGTWDHHRTLALRPGLTATPRVRAEAATPMVRARDELGDLPDGYSICHYPNVAFSRDMAFLLYNVGSYVATANGVVQTQERRLTLVPTSSLYTA